MMLSTISPMLLSIFSNTDTTWKELMEETGESLPELVERYNKDMAASGGKEEPKNIIQRIIEDYQMVSHEHKR